MIRGKVSLDPYSNPKEYSMEISGIKHEPGSLTSKRRKPRD